MSIVKNKASNYHHGDLRNILIKVALEEIEKSDHEKLSLRSLAKKANVSPAAPYRHFSDKEALITALINEGEKKLFQGYEQIMILDLPALEKVEAACHAYIEFTLKHNQLFRLMLTNTSTEHFENNSDKNSFILFEQMILAASKPLSTKELRILTISIWSGIHGLASLRSHTNNTWLEAGITDEEITETIVKNILMMI